MVQILLLEEDLQHVHGLLVLKSFCLANSGWHPDMSAMFIAGTFLVRCGQTLETILCGEDVLQPYVAMISAQCIPIFVCVQGMCLVLQTTLCCGQLAKPHHCCC